MKKKITGTLLLGGLSILVMHIINRIIFTNSTIKDLTHKEESKYYEWRFGKIKYQKEGIGSPLVLLHNLTLGSSSYEFHKLVSELSKKHEVYTLDFLGYGLSEKPNITYTNYLYVQLIIDFIKNVIGKKSSVLTSGSSASIAIMAAHNDSEVIDKIIMLNPSSLSTFSKIPTTQTKILKHLIELPVIGTFIYTMLGNKHQIKKIFETNYFYNKNKINDSILDNYVECIHLPNYQSKFVFSSLLGRYLNTNISHAIKEIDHSIGIIYSEEIDNIESIVDEYIELNSAIEKISISETKQLLHLEKPFDVLEQIKIFLD